MHYTLRNFHKWSGSVLPQWKYFVSLHITREMGPIECNADSIEDLVRQIHEELEKRKMSRSEFNTDFNFPANNCTSNQTSAKRTRPFTEEDENMFLRLLTTQD